MEIRIAICDLSAHLRDYADRTIRHQINNMPNLKNTAIKTFQYAHSDVLLAEHREDNFDIVFIDIAKLKRIELLENIQEINPDVLVILFTMDTKYVYEGYKYHVFRYVLKRNENELIEATRDALNELMSTSKTRSSLRVKTRGAIHQIPYESICYFESKRNNVIIHLQQETYRMRVRMRDLMRQLEEDATSMFVRIHSGYIINLAFTDALENSTAQMKNNISLPVSRSRWKESVLAFRAFYG